MKKLLTVIMAIMLMVSFNAAASGSTTNKDANTLTPSTKDYVTDGLLHYFNALGHSIDDTVWEDLSGNGHDTTTLSFNIDGSSGWKEAGLLFDGKNDAAIIAGYAPFSVDGSFSFELYLKTDDPAESQRIIAFGDSGGRFYFQLASDGYTLAVGTSSFVVGDAATLPAANTLTHIVVVRNDTAYLLWINGEMVNSGTASLKANPNMNRGFVIGSNYDTDYSSFHGTMVLHRFYSRPLSQEEIEKNYANALSFTASKP